MDRKDLDRFYADNTGLVHTVARAGFRRLQAIGAAVDYNDLVQDLTVIFIKAYDLFDEEAGAQFSTYFTSSARNELNKIAKRYQTERIELKIVSVEEMNSWSGGDDESNVEEKIASFDATPEEIVSMQQEARKILESLSPVAAMIVTMTIDPPDFLEHEFQAAQAHAELSRDLGVERRAGRSLNTTFVCSVLEKTTDLLRSEISRAKREILTLAERNFHEEA